ncbi:MAG: sister chromatid cohesion protein PDS5 [Candidatus Melainabacteria bacterium]|jgi:HEAT repeat protein|nr:sister chromatid cohesion protein PDS5 [Candidatus Melainabacteria bacterium]
MSTTYSPELLDELAQFVSDLITQNDYPGFEARAFKVGLPDRFFSASSKLFGAALDHESVFVRLVALRWFEEKPGTIKPFVKAIIDKLSDADEYVRAEALHALEKYHTPTSGNALSCAELLLDQSTLVRKASAKALAKMLPRVNEGSAKELEDVKKTNLERVHKLLMDAYSDNDVLVRQKVEKAMRKSGSFERA